MLFHACGQRLHSAQYEPALERRQNRTGGFLHESQFVGLVLGGAHHNAAEAIAVPIQKFRGGVDHHIGSQRNRLLEVWRHESVVHHQFHLLAAAHLADGFNVAERHERVGGRLDIHHARILANGPLDASRVRTIDVGKFHAEIRQHLVEQPGHASVEIVAADDVIAGFVHGANGVDGSHSTGEDASRDSPLEGHQIFFQASARGVRNPGVFVPFVLAQFLLDVSRSRVDGNGYRTGFRIRYLSGVNSPRGKPRTFYFRNLSSAVSSKQGL